MSKVISRLLIFFIGIPVVIGFVVAPFCNHLLMHLLLCAITVLGASELYDIFSVNKTLTYKVFVVCCSLFITVVASVYAIFLSSFFTQEIITFAYIIAILVLLGLEVFTAKDFKDSNKNLASSVFIITYTGFLITFISRMSVWTINGKSITVPVICVFVLMVFLCDSFAWFFGVLLGKNNREIVKASPNKSIMGFLGGIIGSILAGILGYNLWPEIFVGSVAKIIFVGIIIAMSSIIGDLTESIFKRSASIKDSGNIIPGRGGMLDSIDSIVMSAPIFYLLISLLYGPFNS